MNRAKPGTECAGINRHVVGDERALQERRSDSILTSSLAQAVRPGVVEDPRHAEKRGALWTHENRETSLAPARAGRSGKATSHKPDTRAGEESYRGIVLAKPPNEGPGGPKEAGEGRPRTKENTEEPNLGRIPSRGSESNGLDRVRQAARKDKGLRFTALLHPISLERLRASYHSLKRQAAAGVDGVTWEEYGDGLENRLADRHGRIHRGAYRAKPSRRVWIPKTDGRQRPLGIAALEDKIVQHAVGTVLNRIGEEDFLGFRYGFRPGRSQQDALDALYVGITQKKGNWILDLDIRSFFDKISHAWMVQFVEHRIGDRRIVRLIQKWLKAGVMEDGRWLETEEGTPQGSVISPMLANLYLHYVLDVWAKVWREKVARGDMIIVRYADDGAPRAQRAEEGPMCITAGSMREGPSEPAGRSRFQTTFGGCGQKPWS